MDKTATLRKRLPRDERERLILEEAIRFFAEVGFEGQTRALAQRLGVTQPLLYRYFPDKDTLIERVYEEVYLKRWNPEWEQLLKDRARPLEDRLSAFYRDYCAAIFRPEWVRIFMFAGLKREGINSRFLETVQNHLLVPLCAELRHSHGLPGLDEVPLSDMELNMAWAMHGAVFHIAMRKWIYDLPMPDNLEEMTLLTVRCYLSGCGETLRSLVGKQRAAA
ncbi:tetracycline repressor protein class H [mine drainage metagenome]|uniref:Tetracycline repressor protein class H n=1 Tax=mine drainage metagenome TaxID=410659 RepID=A0A1J5SEC1_9ZZZZ